VGINTSHNPQAGGPPLVGCPRLLIQSIRVYPPHWRPFLHPQPEAVTGTHLSEGWQSLTYVQVRKHSDCRMPLWKMNSGRPLKILLVLLYWDWNKIRT